MVVIDPMFERARDRLRSQLRLATPQLKRYDEYYEGEQPLRFLSPLLKQQLGTNAMEMIVNIARSATEAYENRLDIEGFRFAGADSGDEDLWKVWQHNEGDLLSQQGHSESLAVSRAYTVTGEGDGDVPLITLHSAFDAIHEDDVRTHQVRYGFLQWTDEDGVRWEELYYPEGRLTWFRDVKRKDWAFDSQESNAFGLPRMVPLINDPRILGRKRPGKNDQRLGRSVFHDVIPLVDALNKTLTDMMTSSEFHAMPRRWATGLSEDDFIDEATGKPLATFELIAGRMWGVESDKVKFGQFQEADLTNFHSTAKLLMQVAAQLLALPPHYLTFAGDNPASADAIRSAESQLVKRAERKQAVLASRWERVQRLVLLTQGKPDDDAAKQIETLWRDPATPTIAQKSDAITKLVQAKDPNGRPIVTVDQAREDLGYTPEQRRRMQQADVAATDSAMQAAVQAAAEAEQAARGDTGADAA